MNTKLILLAIVLSSYQVSLYAEIYKWTDENGKIHFGDKPPENSKNHQKIDVETFNNATTTPSNESRLDRVNKVTQDLHESSEKRKKERQQKETSKKEVLKNEQRCLESRINLAKLSEKSLPAYIDDNGNLGIKWKFDTYQGERHYLDETERELEIKKAKNEVKNHCQDPDNQNKQQEARMKWIKSERCIAKKAEFDELINHPDARTPRRTIEAFKKDLDKLCN